MCARLSSVPWVSHKRARPAGGRALAAPQPASVFGYMPPDRPRPGKLGARAPGGGARGGASAGGARPSARRVLPPSRLASALLSPFPFFLTRRVADGRAFPCGRGSEFGGGWNRARAAAPGASARTEQGQAAGSAAGTRRAPDRLQPARGELTFHRPPRAEFFQFVLVVVHVVLKQMHRAVAAAFRHVLEVGFRGPQLPGARQSALQNFPVRDRILLAAAAAAAAALLAFLVKRFGYKSRELLHGCSGLPGCAGRGGAGREPGCGPHASPRAEDGPCEGRSRRRYLCLSI